MSDTWKGELKYRQSGTGTGTGGQQQGQGQVDSNRNRDRDRWTGTGTMFNHLVMDFLTSSNPGCGSSVEMSMNTAESLEDGKGSKGCTSTKPEEREYRRNNEVDFTQSF